MAIHRNDPEAVRWSLDHPVGKHTNHQIGFFSLKDDLEVQRDKEFCPCSMCKTDLEQPFTSKWRYISFFRYLYSGGPMTDEELEKYVTKGSIERYATGVGPDILKETSEPQKFTGFPSRAIIFPGA